MALKVLESIRNAWLTTLAAAIDAGSAGGKVNFYDGTQPATGGSITNLLGTVTCSTTCYSSITGGVLTFASFTQDSSANASGTATWARITDSDDNFVCDCTVGTSGTDIILNSAVIASGGIISITSGTITAGNA